MNFIERFLEESVPYLVFRINKFWVHTCHQLQGLREKYEPINLLCEFISSCLNAGNYLMKCLFYNYMEPRDSSWITIHSYTKGYRERYIPVSQIWSNLSVDNPNAEVYRENIDNGIKQISDSVTKEDLVILKLDNKYHSFMGRVYNYDTFSIPCSYHFIEIELVLADQIIEIELGPEWFNNKNCILSSTFIARYLNHLSIFAYLSIDENYEIRTKLDVSDYKINVVDHNGLIVTLTDKQFIRLNKDDYEVIDIE